MSSAFLYLAIVAIWAFVLIPRWLRRPHLLGGETAEPESESHDDTSAEFGNPAAASEETQRYDPASGRPALAQPGRRPLAQPPRSRVLQARRRLLTILITLTAVAGACTYLKLTSWWACVPPAGMLGMYLLLLRESALADAERAHWRAAEHRRVQAARQVAHAERLERTAQIIDISVRLGDQLYDQYADATIRAVGD